MTITYTIFTDDFSTGDFNDIDLPAGTTLQHATNIARGMATQHQHRLTAIRVAAYIPSRPLFVRCVFANHFAYSRNLVNR